MVSGPRARGHHLADHISPLAVPRLAAAGVTDFRTLLRVPQERHAARAMLTELAGHFADAAASG